MSAKSDVAPRRGATAVSNARTTQPRRIGHLHHSGRRRFLWLIRYGVLLVALVIVLFPLAFLFVTSLRPDRDFLSGSLIPSSFTLDHYRVAFAEQGVAHIFMNSVKVTAATTIISVIAGTMAAYALARIRISQHLVSFIMFSFIFIRFYPRIATVVPWFLIARKFNLLDTVTAVVLGHLGITVPFVTWLMYIMFKDLPPELEEAAAVDGAPLFKRFWHVVLPISAPGMVSAAIFTAFLSWNEFLIASSVTREGAKVLPVAVAGFVTDKGVQWGPMAAMSVVIVIPMMVFALVAQRYLVKGLTLGAVKG